MKNTKLLFVLSVCLFTTRAEVNFETALHNADKAMYHAKQTTGNSYDIIV